MQRLDCFTDAIGGNDTSQSVVEGGHVSVAIERSASPTELVGPIRSAFEGQLSA